MEFKKRLYISLSKLALGGTARWIKHNLKKIVIRSIKTGTWWNSKVDKTQFKKDYTQKYQNWHLVQQQGE